MSWVFPLWSSRFVLEIHGLIVVSLNIVSFGGWPHDFHVVVVDAVHEALFFHG